MPDDVLPPQTLGRDDETSRDERTGFHVRLTNRVRPARGFRFDWQPATADQEALYGRVWLTSARAEGHKQGVPKSEYDRAGSAAGGRKSRREWVRKTHDDDGNPLYSPRAYVHVRRCKVWGLMAEGLCPAQIAKQLGCLDRIIRYDVEFLTDFHDEGQ